MNCICIIFCTFVSEVEQFPGTYIFFKLMVFWGTAVAQLVEAVCYKPEGHRFNSRWCHNPFSHTMALGLAQPVTEMGTRNISWG
jgi:hypothetical protein